MNAQKIGAIAVVMVFLATAFGAFATGFNTETTSSYTNPTSSTYAKEYDHDGLTIVNDYTNDNYTINTSSTDDVGLIVSDQAIIDFSPTATNVNVYTGTTINHISTSYDVECNLTHCSASGFVETSSALTLTVTADTGYNLPATITATVGDTAYSGYTWSSGSFSMPLSDITDDVSLTITATIITYSYSVTVTGATADKSTGSIEYGDDLTVTFTPTSSSYEFDSLTVTINNVTSTNYTFSNNVLTISHTAITGNITVSATYINSAYRYYGLDGLYYDYVASSKTLIISPNGNNTTIWAIKNYGTFYDSEGTKHEYLFGNNNTPETLVKHVIVSTGITAITGLPSSIDSYASGGRAFGNWKFTDISLPDTLLSISHDCFSGNDYLTELRIPDSVTTINNNAMASLSALTYLSFGTGLTSLGYYIIYNTPLTSVYIYATTPPTIQSNSFNTSTLTTIYVPSSSVSAYQSASNWSTYASMISAMPVGSLMISPYYATYTDIPDLVTYTYTKVWEISSLTIVYYQNTLTLTSDKGTLTIPNVEKICLINKVLTSSEYYVYHNNITSKYYAKLSDAITYGTTGNGYLFAGTTQKIGSGLTATASTDTTDTSISSIKEYAPNTTPITISGISDQYTMLDKTVSATNGEKFKTEYMVGGITLILVGIALALAIFRRD